MDEQPVPACVGIAVTSVGEEDAVACGAGDALLFELALQAVMKKVSAKTQTILIRMKYPYG